jgi:Na+/proline symporter
MRILLAVGGSVFFAALAFGSTWVAWDMRGGAEQSELLGIPYLPLRVVVTIAMFVIALIYARRIVAELAAP